MPDQGWRRDFRDGTLGRMPIEYRIDRERHLVLANAFGLLSDEVLIGHTAELHRDPEHTPSMDEIFDATAVDEFTLTSAGVRVS